MMMTAAGRWRLAWAVVGLGACGARPLGVTPSGHEAEAAGSTEGYRQALTAAGACAVAAPGRGWTTVALPRQTGAFTWDFNARPAGMGTDAVVGLVNGTASGYSSLAAIVRFGPSGVIDVRRGNAYAADTSFSYTAGEDYHVRMAVDMASHRYSVWVSRPGWAPVQLASNYAFRAEQAAVTALDGFAAFLDPSAAGGVQVCGAVIGPPISLSGDSRCAHSTVGGAWINRPVDRQTGRFFFEFDATPWNYSMDGVVGVSLGGATGYDRLAAIARFAPSGIIDARNGGGYSNYLSLIYAPGVPYHVSMAIDLVAHRYSMWAGQIGTRPSLIANNHAFRTSQGGVTALDNAGQFVDPASTGPLTVCVPQAERPGQPLWAGVPEPFLHLAVGRAGTTLLASRPGTTVVIDPTTGQVVRRVGVGGLITVTGSTWDTTTYYVADRFAGTSIGDGTRMYIARFDANWNLRWATPFNGSGAIALSASERRGVAVASLGDGITFYDKDAGQQGWVLGPSASSVAFDPDDYLHVTGNFGSGIHISALTVFGSVWWRRDYTSDSALTATSIVVDADGNTVSGGTLAGTVDFGGGPLSSGGAEPTQVGYLVRLSRTGDHLYSRTLPDIHGVRALAADVIGQVAVAGTPHNAPTIEHGKVDSTGQILWWHSGVTSGIGNGLGWIDGLTADAFGRSHLLVEPNGNDLPSVAAYAP